MMQLMQFERSFRVYDILALSSIVVRQCSNRRKMFELQNKFALNENIQNSVNYVIL